MNVSKALLVGTLCLATVSNPLPAQAQDGAVIGGFLGAIIGGLTGNAIGNGDTGSTIAGALIGGALGAVVGNEIEEADRRAVAEARYRALQNNRPYEWDGSAYGSRSGAAGRIVVTREGYWARDNSWVCREYSSEVWFRNRFGGVERRTTTTSQACQDRYGNWTEVQSTEVVYGRRGGRGPVMGGFPQPVPDYGRPLPAPVPVPSRIVPDREVYDTVLTLRQIRFDDERNSFLSRKASRWSRLEQRMTSDRLYEILVSYDDDDERLDAVHILRPVILVTPYHVENAIRAFRNSWDAREAREILLGY